MSKTKVLKILIANRGEIALRVQKTCLKLKIPCAITVSEADHGSYFATKALEAVFIKGYSAKDSYLNIVSILKAAKKHKCNAVHPGYGFLSENAEFAKKVIKAGFIFIGPNPECIEALGDKAKARKIAGLTKVPVTPGTAPNLSDKELLSAAERIGYPVLIKAISGGGGRGMRIVEKPGDLLENIKLARSEALKNFLDKRVYLEKYIEKPRHVEVQIVGDNFGNILHLGTRDCSTQRRHQKLIEEAPAPFLSPKLRSSLHDAAIRIASKVNYNSVGTAEFLVSKDKFYFLEMNTRIQVEHPISEEITGLDLIKLQIESALNKELKIKQTQIKFKGHSIEFRINAENPKENFKPLTGKIQKIWFPKNSNMRIESGFQSGDEISPYYDGMISKIIINGKDRKACISNSKTLLEKIQIEGLETTLAFHRWAVSKDIFMNSTFDIAYIGREFKAAYLLEDEARLLTDDLYRSPKSGNLHTEILNYTSSQFDYKYILEIIHLKDKTFLFIPKSSKGKPAKETYCRRSNSYNAAFESLKSEVLEKESPKKLFS